MRVTIGGSRASTGEPGEAEEAQVVSPFASGLSEIINPNISCENTCNFLQDTVRDKHDAIKGRNSTEKATYLLQSR